MNWMVLPNQVCLIVKLYNNRPGLLPDSNEITYIDEEVIFNPSGIVYRNSTQRLCPEVNSL